ncbi:MAG: hypothetical protein ABIL16_08575 [candidate division WOR-3 bacterium]
MKRLSFIIFGLLFITSCKEKVSISHTSVFGVGGATGPALRSFYSILPSNITPPSFPAFLDTIKYETAIFKVLVDGQEDPSAHVQVGSTLLKYYSDKGLFMLADSNGIPQNINLSGGTNIRIHTAKYGEDIQFTLPSVNPPDSISVDTIFHSVGDSIFVSWNAVSGADSIQVFFKLNDQNPYIKNLPPNATSHYIPSSVVSDTGTALLMINVLKYIKIEKALTPSTMLLIKGTAFPMPIRIQ